MWLENLGDTTDVIFFAFCAAGGATLMLALCNFIGGLFGDCTDCCDDRHDRPAATSVDLFGCLGAVLLVVSVLLRGVDTKWADYDELEIICEIYPVILLMGLTMFVGNLFVRAWSIYIFYQFNSDKRPRRQEWKPNLWIWVLMLIIGAVSVIWVVVDTPEMEDSGNFAKNRDWDVVDTTEESPVYTCTTSNGHDMEWKVATSIWHGILLLLACAGCMLNCGSLRHNLGLAENTILFVVIVNTILSVVAGVLVHYVYGDELERDGDPKANKLYSIKGGLMIWIAFFSQFMALVGKCRLTARQPHDTQDGKYDTINSGRSGSP